MYFHFSFPLGKHTVKFETGILAKQASASVKLEMDDTVVLATVVVARNADPKQKFLPLTVDYIEKSYAAGRIPGNVLRREGALSENEILVSRLIDRSIRPLFPDGFTNEVQVVVQVLSINPDVEPDIPALLATSAALKMAGVPFMGTVGAVRVGYRAGEYLLNPTPDELKDSKLNLLVAGTELGVLMVEAEANELSEDTVLNAIVYGHKKIQAAIEAIHYFAARTQQPTWAWHPQKSNECLESKVRSLAGATMEDIYQLSDRSLRADSLENLKTMVHAVLTKGDEAVNSVDDIQCAIEKLERTIVRQRILDKKPRIDGRNHTTVRPLAMRTAVLPRAHGSALFTRGETQALAVATLGNASDAQLVNSLIGRHRERFMLHYNMPPFATGETGRVGTPKRREVGHGRLAKRALEAVLPDEESFPYTIRVVSEIMESNGSSSMASVCGGCLALLDAGVPIKRHVAGIAMGLIVKGSQFAVLTDILGEEDHLGDMDFKVAGTEIGITALQMDIKVHGVSLTILQAALTQARQARMEIIDAMRQHIDTARPELSPLAPQMKKIALNPARIRDVIGPGGMTIRAIKQKTGTSVDIQEDGTITISGPDVQSVDRAAQEIELLTADVVVGAIYPGIVRKVLEYGAIVAVLPGKNGLLHISEISDQPVTSVTDYVSEGQTILVKVIAQSEHGRIQLSMKAGVLEAAADNV